MTRRILIALALLAIAGAADARSLTDQYGATVVVSADNSTYTVSRPDGFSATVKPLVAGDDAAALKTINAMCSGGQCAAAPVAPTEISGEAFWARFTAGQQAAVASAAQTNATVMMWLVTALSAKSINLLDPKTAQGMAILGPAPGAGILTQAQIANILDPKFTAPQ